MFDPAVYACCYCPGLLLSLTWFWGLLKIPLSHVGLWEFPSCAVKPATADEHLSQQAVIDGFLATLLGCNALQDTGKMKLVWRTQLGSLVHTFSHIQQTMHVELLRFQVSTHAFVHSLTIAITLYSMIYTAISVISGIQQSS